MIISFSSLGSLGRLANQLMQIHSTLGMAEKYGAEAVFPSWKYEQYFTEALPHGKMQTGQVREKYFHHYDWALTGDCDIVGYLQSEKYFGSKRLRFTDTFLQAQRDKHHLLFLKPTICCHVRRGDYVGNPNYYQLPVTYYIDSLYRYFPGWKSCNVLFISDDIEYCRNHFECMPNAFFSKGNSDIEDMALASCCDDFIIPNSSFGWWCAYINEQEGSKVIHPGYLTTGKLAGNDVKDYWPERWIENKRPEYKLTLKDVTFTIPLFYDHKDRKDNADLSLCILQKNFDASFIIMEQGGNKFEYMSQWVKYMKLPGTEFHRTKMLNDMAVEAQTDIIVNWDCDVIIPPMQILLGAEAIRNGADMVFPYDGRFARLPRKTWFPEVQKHLDIGVVGEGLFKGREHGHNSVGGAVMFNKDAFIDGGMENETMISFGPEDCERNDRFKKLGYRVERVGGSLFHIDHFCGFNSNTSNPHFKANHKEIEKIRGMSTGELRAYVDTWAWRHKYSSQYYHRISEGAVRSAAIVMDAIGSVGSVIDIGCGVGEWNNGNQQYTGVDYKVTKKDLLIPPERFIECNFEKGWPVLSDRYDLCLCLEVAEHLRPHRAEGLIKLLCSLSDRVLFSAAIPYQGGTGHYNEQWQTYWEGLFKDNGFGAAKVQPNVRVPGVELWYQQNIVLYERGGTGVVSDFVLPEYYMQIVKHTNAVTNA